MIQEVIRVLLSIRNVRESFKTRAKYFNPGINIFDLIIVKKLTSSTYFLFINRRHIFMTHIFISLHKTYVQLNWIINRYSQALSGRDQFIMNTDDIHCPRWHNTLKKTLWYSFRMTEKLYYKRVSKYFKLKRYAFEHVKPSCLLIVKSRYNYRRCGSVIKILSQYKTMSLDKKVTDLICSEICSLSWSSLISN